MNEIIAACGLICSECNAYKATINDDMNLREKTAEFWSTIYGSDIATEDINCLGCLTDGIKFSHCKFCEIRKCCEIKGLPNCAHCPEYSCDKLYELFQHVPKAKIVLDSIISNIK
ncbi:MAG: DUF3795 domain-containing protein [Candidatus Cloacimonetes bacterium]|nr:DUF3795 domain-containing protein [Candidatus Cloacimonadota bacterium]